MELCYNSLILADEAVAIIFRMLLKRSYLNTLDKMCLYHLPPLLIFSKHNFTNILSTPTKFRRYLEGVTGRASHKRLDSPKDEKNKEIVVKISELQYLGHIMRNGNRFQLL